MLRYISYRLLLIIPTLLGIMVINFAIIQFAPGGPVERAIAELQGVSVDATSRLFGTGSDTQGADTQSTASSQTSSKYRGVQGIRPEIIAKIEKQYGFDKPAHQRFWLMVKNYTTFDFGESYFSNKRVIDLIFEKMPVSISLGLWTTLIVYLISIPLGIKKAVNDGTRFDTWSSTLIVIGSAVPAFLFAIFLIIVFSGGRYFDLFPLRGLVSDGWEDFPWWQQIADYFWHMTLPIIALVLGGFASLTMLTKNSFLDQIKQQYVLTARAKGLSEKKVLYGHVFRNAMLIVIAGFPSVFIGILFTGALLIEVIFSLDGLGLLGFEAAIHRDYPVMFGTLYIFTLVGLLLQIIRDVMYTIVDPRIDFESRAI